MKEPRLFIALMFCVLFLMFGWEHIKAEKYSEQVEVLTDSLNVLNTEKSALYQKSWNKDAINLIIMNNMCKQDQESLQQDSVYLKLVTKYD